MSSKISALTAASAAASTQQIPVNDSGTTKRLTVAQVIALLISDTAYDASAWNGVTDVAPSKNAVRDIIAALAQANITGLTTADSPQFAGLNIGHASDTTIARAAAGAITIEGKGVWRVLAADAAGVSCPGDTNENTLVTISIPAGAMGANGQFRLWTLWTTTSSGNNKTIRARLGGIGGTAFLSSVLTTFASANMLTHVANRNSASSQVGTAGSTNFSAAAGGVVTGAIDTSSAQDLVITAQKASAGETITLERYVLEILYQA